MEGEAVTLFCAPWESLDQIFKQSVKFTYPMNLVKGGTFSFKWSSSVCFQSFAIDSRGDLTKTYLTCTNNSSQLAGIQTRVNQKVVTFRCFVIEDVNNKTVVEMRVFFQTSCYSHTYPTNFLFVENGGRSVLLHMKCFCYYSHYTLILDTMSQTRLLKFGRKLMRSKMSWLKI